MAQGKQLSWSDLRVGLFVLAGAVIIAVAIFYVTAPGAFKPKYRLVTYLPEAEGLNQGAPVTVDGVQAGNVESVRVAPHAPGTPTDVNRAVEVVMRINRDQQQYIRSDSVASLITQGFLGNREVTIQRGYTGRVLMDGDQVEGTEEKALQQVVARSADLIDNLNKITSQASDILNDVKAGRGTLGKLLVDQNLYTHIENTAKHLDQVTTSVQKGQGTLGKLVASNALYDKADSAVGHADNLLAAVDEKKGTLGKLVYDPAVHDELKDMLANGNNLLSNVNHGEGTLGKLATDDSLFAAWRQTGTNLADVTAKLQSSGNTAGELFTDPKLYQNLTGLTGDLRQLVSDFRSNPKKFLHIKMSIF